MTPSNRRNLLVILLTFVTLTASLSLLANSGRNPQSGQCVFDPATSKCAVQGGGFCTAGNGAGNCAMGENACWCYLPNYNLSVSPFAPPSQYVGKSSTSTVTVTPAPGATGFLGDVNLSVSCPSSAWICTLPAKVTLTSSAPLSSTLTAIPPSSSTCDQTYTITVTGHDASPSAGPTNGPQSATLKVRCDYNVGPDWGGGSIALLTFLSLLALWTAWGVFRGKRTIPR